MNCYDFDKTIYRYDSSLKFYFYCLRKKPKMIFHFIKTLFLYICNMIGLLATKSFKEKFFSFLKYFNNIDEIVEKFWDKNISKINSWYFENCKDSDIICSASPKFLVEPAIKKINKNVTVIATNMDKTSGKITGENLKGEEKVKELCKILNVQKDFLNFDEVYTDSLSDFPILDLAKNKYIVCGKKYYTFGKQKPTFFQKIKYLIKQLRVKHYVKNGLIFMPLFFSGNLSDINFVLKSVLGFCSFCLMASFVYIVNDLFDVKNDRKHSKKRKRPIASYMIKEYEAIIIAIVLLIWSLSFTYLVVGFDLLVFAIIIGYGLINLLYSLVLKNIPLVDVFILASCYLFRIFYGGLIIDTPVSKWLYLTILCGALFMGFGKRRNELKMENETTRKVNRQYSYEFLDKNLYISLAMCLVFYSLWAIDFKGIDFGGLNQILLYATIPIVYFIMMRYSYNIEKMTNNGDPIDVLLKDYILILSVFVFVILIIVSIYFQINIKI